MPRLCNFRQVERLESRNLLTTFTPTMLADFSIGAESSEFSGFYASSNLLYFNVNDGQQFWSTDGTPAGTNRLPDVGMLGEGTETLGLTLFNVESSNGNTVWRTNGTFEGTFELVSGTLVKAQETSDASFLIVQQENAVEVWRTDGTLAGSERILTLDGDIGVPEIIFDDDLIYVSQQQLYSSDGTEAGTTLLHSAAAGPVVADQGTFFLGNDDGQTILYRTDGTPAGTSPVTGVARELLDNLPSMRGLDHQLLFMTSNAVWGSDGTASGTVKLGDVNQFWGGWATDINGVALYQATSTDLWRTDGSAEGTYLLASLPSSPTHIGQANGKAYFVTLEEFFELVSTDGTTSTSIIRGVQASASFDGDERLIVHLGNGPSGGPGRVVMFDVFAGTESTSGGLLSPGIDVGSVADVWYSAGTDFLTGDDRLYRGEDRIDFSSPVASFLTRGNTAVNAETRQAKTAEQPLFFVAGTPGNQSLWALDGGLSPTEIGSIHTRWHYTDDGFFFVRSTDTQGTEVWVSDGTVEGTQAIEGSAAEESDAMLLKWNDNTLIIAETAEFGRELSVITADAIPDLVPGDIDGNRSVDFSDFLILSANFGKTEVGRSDGDLDEDGVVAFSDFLLLAANFPKD